MDIATAIEQLDELAENWPAEAWVFAAPGGLYVMRRGEDYARVMTASGGVDPEYIVACIAIPSDGGDW